MKAGKYREMSAGELQEQVDGLRTEMFNLRKGNVTKDLKDTSKIGQTRRELARVLTVLGQKNRAQEGGKAQA